MSNCIRITLVANAGVLVEHNGLGILVDGIHHENGHPFSRVSERDIWRMRQRADIFANLHYLLFTHEHPDHFSPQQVSEYLRFQSVKGLFLPDESNGSLDLAFLLQLVRELGIRHWTLGLEPGEVKRIMPADGLLVTAIGARHMGPQFANVANDCFLLTLAGQNLLFTGDADYVPEYFENGLEGVAVDTVFVNPIFYHNANGQEIIREIFRPHTVVIYHMPFARDDSMRFSYMVNSDIEKHGCPGIKTRVLNRERQMLHLTAPEPE